jgi:hypothetical protein
MALPSIPAILKFIPIRAKYPQQMILDTLDTLIVLCNKMAKKKIIFGYGRIKSMGIKFWCR